MTGDELDALQGNPGRGRALEWRAFLFAVRPIATDLGSSLVFYAVPIASGRSGGVRSAAPAGQLGADQGLDVVAEDSQAVDVGIVDGDPGQTDILQARALQAGVGKDGA
jgi:hypothetical protein